VKIVGNLEEDRPSSSPNKIPKKLNLNPLSPVLIARSQAAAGIQVNADPNANPKTEFLL
jgi:hypothetical protein